MELYSLFSNIIFMRFMCGLKHLRISTNFPFVKHVFIGFRYSLYLENDLF
jgi:hypothetical protein